MELQGDNKSEKVKNSQTEGLELSAIQGEINSANTQRLILKRESCIVVADKETQTKLIRSVSNKKGDILVMDAETQTSQTMFEEEKAKLLSSVSFQLSQKLEVELKRLPDSVAEELNSTGGSWSGVRSSFNENQRMLKSPKKRFSNIQAKGEDTLDNFVALQGVKRIKIEPSDSEQEEVNSRRFSSKKSNLDYSANEGFDNADDDNDNFYTGFDLSDDETYHPEVNDSYLTESDNKANIMNLASHMNWNTEDIVKEKLVKIRFNRKRGKSKVSNKRNTPRRHSSRRPKKFLKGSKRHLDCQVCRLSRITSRDHLNKDKHKGNVLKLKGKFIHCSVCKKALHSMKVDLGKHYDRHQSFMTKFKKICVFRPMKFQCPKCRYRATSGQNLKFHRLLKHKKSKMMTKKRYVHCPWCSVRKSSAYALRCHLHMHRRPTKYSCYSCQSKFSNPNDMYKHSLFCEKRFFYTSLADDVKSEHKCSKCSYKASGQSDLVLHDFKDHQPDVIMTEEQGFATTGGYLGIPDEYQGMLRQMRDRDRNILCPICGLKRVDKRTLLKHLREHAGTKPFACPIEGCTTAYNGVKALQVHIITHMSKEFKCQHCPKAFHTKSHLKSHMLRMHRAKPAQDAYVCDICGKGTKFWQDMYEHTKSHKAKTIKCSQPGCPLMFKNHSQRLTHEKTHSNVYSFVCEDCGHKSRTKDAMQKHRKIMHQPRPEYSCPHCDTYTTKNLYALKRHIKVHLDIKDYTCIYCDYRSTFIGNIKKHIVEKHPGYFMYPCWQCDFGSQDAKALMMHRVNQHGAVHMQLGELPPIIGLYKPQPPIDLFNPNLPPGYVVKPVSTRNVKKTENECF